MKIYLLGFKVAMAFKKLQWVMEAPFDYVHGPVLVPNDLSFASL